MANEVAELLDEARRQGWRVVHGKKHWKLFAPDGTTTIILAATPSTGKSIRDTVALMRRAGFVWKGH